MNASKQHNYSGQTAVYDRVIQLSDSAIDVKSLITDTKSSREIAVNNFLSTYDLVADGENMILSGATIRAKIINKATGEEVLGIAKPTEFIWYDDENNIIANGIDKYTFEATKFIGKLEKKFRIVWNHIIEYSIGDTLHEANIEYVVNFTLRVLEITQYIWTNCLTEQELEEQGYKQSGLWSDTISENPQNYLYLWVRKSTNNRLTWVYYRSTGEQGQKGENGVSAKNININSTRHYFDRAEKKSDGSKGDYVANQIAILSLTYIGIEDTEQVEWYFNGSLRFTLAINQTININYTFLENNDTLTISVKYNGKEYDSIQIKTNVIKSSYAGVLPSSDISPVVINGREVIDGDHFIYINSNGVPIVRLYTNGDWKDLTGDDTTYYSQVMSNVLYDVMKQKSVISTENGSYKFFEQLATFSAFIENLFANYIKISGAIYGGSYDKDGIQVGEDKGFYLNKNGLFKAYLAELNDVYIKSLDNNGTVIIETKKQEVSGTRNISCLNNMWNKAILYSYVNSEYIPCVFNGNSRYISLVKTTEEKHLTTINAYADANSTMGSYIYYYDAKTDIDLRCVVIENINGSGTVGGNVSINGVYKYQLTNGKIISLKSGDNLSIDLTADYHVSSPYDTGSVSIGVDIYERIPNNQIIISTTNTSFYPNDWKVDNETEYVKHTLTFSGFNSNNFLEKSSHDRLKDQLSSLTKGVTLYTDKTQSYLTYNGTTTYVRAISISDNYAVFYFESGTRTIIFSDVGVEFTAKLVILANPTSLIVCNLLPSLSQITDIGSSSNKFNNFYSKVGYFDKLYVNGKEIT